jgi:hypothetical protein
MNLQIVKRYAVWYSTVLLVLAAAGFNASSQQATQPTLAADFKLTPERQAVLERVSENSLRGHLSFIASDLLEGRATPSRGLDIAAEYIAAQFRRAGLEPVGDANERGEKSYFQTANWQQMEGNPATFALTLSDGQQKLSVSAAQVSFAGDQALELSNAKLFKLDYKDADAVAALKPEQVVGKVVIVEAAPPPQLNNLIGKLRPLNPALLVLVDRSGAPARGLGSRRAFDPENRTPSAVAGGLVSLTLHDLQVASWFDALSAGETAAALSLRLAASVAKPVKLHNVVGLLRGSDASLKDSYVLVTAHYDHLGNVAPRCTPVGGDTICNGANDDGSGTVSVIELASALSTLKERPKRSILFMTVFGEESGLLGSRYYGRHPIFPIEKTVADVNLEHVGRTDDVEGDKTGTATLTGFDFTDLGPIFKQAGELTGVNVYKHQTNSDSFFNRSDNQALADQGVPAHTLCVAFIFPDYHKAGDHWDKINYPNLAKTNRMVALALLMLADSTTEPKWNEANPKTARYVQAWKTRRGQ